MKPSPSPPGVTVILFSGGGWTLAFHYGVAKCLQEHFDTKSNDIRFGGISGGSLIAAGLALNCDIMNVQSENFKTHPDFPTRSTIKKTVLIVDPGETAWVNATNRLIISVSKLNWLFYGPPPMFAEVSFFKFDSQSMGIDVLCASCNFPILAGILPLVVNNVGYYDGTFAAIFPALHGTPIIKDNAGNDIPYNSIEVCSYKNGYNICPGFVIPIMWMLSPPPVDVLMKLTDLGYLRAIEYFTDPVNKHLFIHSLRRCSRKFSLLKIRKLISKHIRYLETYKKWPAVIPMDDCFFLLDDITI